MKKRVISVFLIFALCLTLFPVSALATHTAEDETDAQTEPVDGVGAAPESEEPSGSEEDEEAVEATTEPQAEQGTESSGEEESSATAEDGATCTRGEWIHELVAVFDLTLTEDEYPDIYFPDIVGTTYFDDIMVAAKYGLISVEAGDDFRPDDPLTREFAAQTMNFYLGILNEREEYTYSDSSDVSAKDDVQVALDQGWLDLVAGAFFPQAAVSDKEKNAMLESAAAILASRNSTEEHHMYQFAEWVKVLPDSVEVETEIDRETKVRSVTITGYDGSLEEGDTFVFYYEDFAFVYAADTVKKQGDVYTVITGDAPEGAVLEYEYAGTIRPEITAVIPDEEPVTLMTTDGDTVTFGSVEVRSSNGYSKDFSRPFTLSDGTTGTLTAKISNVTVTPNVNSAEISFDLSGDLELGSTIVLKLLEDPAIAHIPLGEVQLGGFGYAGLSINLSAQATLGFWYKTSFSVGATYDRTKNSTHTHNYWESAEASYLSADGEFSAMLALGGYLSFMGSSASAEIKAGPILNAGFKVYLAGTPSRCFNADGYLYAVASASYKLVAPVTGKVVEEDSWKKEFFNRKNSPVRFVRHLEDDEPVATCTRKNDEGTITGNYRAGNYTTPSTSRYYNYASSYGSSTGYGGYGSTEPVVIWTTSDNDDGTVTITGYQGNASILNIPETIDGKTVTQIGSEAFKGNTMIRVVIFPDTITTIGSSAFFECVNLKSISFGESLLKIDTAGFYGCTSLVKVDLPEVTKWLGGQAFGNCTSLVCVNIPDALETCTLGYGDSWDKVYEGPFSRCSNLTEITFGEDVTVIPANLFYGCTGLKEISVPDTVAQIGASAFSKCVNLKSISFGENLLKIDTAGFYGCASLVKVDLPEVTKWLGGQAFGDCISLVRVNIPDALETCTLGYGDSWDKVYEGPFSRCSNLTEITFGEDVTAIPGNLFYGCTGLKEITIPDTVTEIGSNAFYKCTNLKNVSFGESLLKIGDAGFYGCTSLAEVNLPEVTKWLGGQAFGSCTSLVRVNIPNALETCTLSTGGGVYEGPFSQCGNLTEITFGEDVTAIPANLFYGCTGLKEIAIPDTITKIGTSAFKNCTNLTSVKLPDISQIVKYMFAGCTSLTDLSWIPRSVTQIADYAFQGCTGLVEVELSDLVSEVDSYAFQGCTNMVSFKAGNDLLTIGNYCFQNCTKLTDVELNDGLESIGSYGFQNCSALTGITLPNTVSSIGTYCFQKDSKLAEVKLSSKMTAIPSYAFANCTSLTELVLPKGVTTIGSYAFANDTKLKTFTIPDSVTSIGDNAFSYATTTTVNGVAGSYAETYAKWKAFNDITQHADSLALASGKDRMTIPRYTTFTPTFTLEPEDSTDLITLTSDNANIVSVKNGISLYGQSYGTANVTATTSDGKSLTFPVTVDKATGIEVGSLPSKTAYTVGERKDRSGLVINQVFSNGDKEQVFGYQLRGFDTKTVGEKTITVTRESFTTTFSIYVGQLVTGVLGGQEELHWSYSSGSGQLTVTGDEINEQDVVIAVTYDENGKMTGVYRITASGGTAAIGNSFEKAKLLWIDQNALAKCESVEIAAP